jgi:archaellum biogenesis ATPase FlaH
VKPQDILKLNNPPVILVFGPAGTGKTALITQASGGYVFDFDNGMRSAATLNDKFFDVRQNVEFDVFVEEDPKNPIQYSLAIQKLMQIVAACRAKTWKFDALIVDGITGLSKTIIYKVMKDEAGDALSHPQRNNWGGMVSYMEAFMAQLRMTGKLVLVTAHINSLEDETGNLLSLFPSSITRNHGMKSLPWMFDEIWYASREPAGEGKINYVVDGSYIYKVNTRTRCSFGKVIHNEIGLAGVLEKVGYKYGRTEQPKV